MSPAETCPALIGQDEQVPQLMPFRIVLAMRLLAATVYDRNKFRLPELPLKTTERYAVRALVEFFFDARKSQFTFAHVTRLQPPKVGVGSYDLENRAQFVGKSRQEKRRRDAVGEFPKNIPYPTLTETKDGAHGVSPVGKAKLG